MKYSALFLALVLVIFLSGCAHEAYYADREHGIAQRDAFDQQIIHQDYAHAGKPVEGMEGIFAEHIMGEYLDTYKEGFTKEGFDITETGLEGN